MLQVSPHYYLDPILVGEEEQYTLDCVDQLDGDTISAVAIVYTDEDGDAVTNNFAKGDSDADGVITFGLTGYAAGTYTITITVTCSEKLPDTTTAREFIIKLYLTVE